tara:strand:+ start:2694 stop:4523 length:1830 start_codon:yes stop_codon:yes gene_type:complete
MAQTFRPYQSQGVALNQLNLPQGAEAQEASRTMQVLSQGLNRMSEFAFRQARVEAEIEGERFGVEFMSLKKLREANQNNENIFDLPEFGNTVFGKSARRSALTILENETLIEATKNLNDLVFKAETNLTSPTVLNNQINATILGYVNALAPSAPILAKKISASLQMNGARLYDSYRSAHAKSTTGNLQAKSLIGLITKLDVEKGKFHALWNFDRVEQSAVDAQREVWLAELDSPTYGLKTQGKKDFRNMFEETLTSFIKDKAFEHINDSGGSAYEEIQKIRNATTSNEKLNKFLKLRASDSDFRKKIADDLLQILRNKRAEENNNDLLKENNDKNNIEKLKKEFAKNTYGEDGLINYEKAEVTIRKMMNIDADEGLKLRKTLNSAEGGVRLESDLTDDNVRAILANPDNATYDMLNTLIEENKLSMQDIIQLDKTIDANVDVDFKGAMAIVAKNLVFNATDLKIKALDKTTKLKEQAFLNVKEQLMSLRDNAKRNNTEINLRELAETLTQNVDQDLQKALKTERKKLFKNLLLSSSIKLTNPDNAEKFGINVDDVPEIADLAEFGNYFVQFLSSNRTNNAVLTAFALTRDSVDIYIQNLKDQIRLIGDE